MRWLEVATMVVTLGLAVSCSEQGNPFPYVPNQPNDFNRSTKYSLKQGETEELLGEVAMFTHEVFEEYFEGLVSEHTVCFDSAGHCLELLYRDRETNQHYIFQYDSLGRRVVELCYMDSAGTPYDSISTLYTRTDYSYSRNGRTCRARITGPKGKRYTYRLRYDHEGHLHRLVFPDGSRLTYDYDICGRLARITFPDASYQTFEYDEAGDMTSMRDREGVMHWYIPDHPTTEYDTCGNIIEEVSYANGAPRVTQYTRDDHGNWTRRTSTGVSSYTRIDNRTIKYFTK